jgi:hypothetical protein
MDFEIPAPQAAPPRRSTRLTAAAGVLLLTGVFDLVGFALVISTHDSTNGIQRGFARGAALMLLALAALNLLAGLLVLRLQPNGRLLGLIVGGIGVLIGLTALASAPAKGLPTLVLTGFVVWVLATEGPAFHPPDAG